MANLKGPGVITMIHFALPAMAFSSGKKMGREVVLRIWWDGEKSPSVECPLVDFFCDPNGQLERVNTALVNKKRGWNCYFPMPFAKSARVEITNENRRGGASWDASPCYAYVMYHPLKSVPEDTGYFHATWRKKALLLGKEEYCVFEAIGSGHFIGWNVALEGVARPNSYPVDENVKFAIDGEKEPSIEWQGIEDSFGFSWGFPEVANEFPYTGYQPWQGGAAAYRFCLNDRISFTKSLEMRVGFGKNDHPMFRTEFSKPGSELEFSSTAYWYQIEPHKPLEPLPAPAMAALDPNLKPSAPGETLFLNCGSKSGDIQYLKAGWDYSLENGYSYAGFPSAVNHCWASDKTLGVRLYCPKRVAGTLRLYIIDGDDFMGGRRQSMTVAGRSVGVFEDFQEGRWIEVPISAADTAKGEIPITAKTLHANAVISKIQFVEGQ